MIFGLINFLSHVHQDHYVIAIIIIIIITIIKSLLALVQVKYLYNMRSIFIKLYVGFKDMPYCSILWQRSTADHSVASHIDNKQTTTDYPCLKQSSHPWLNQK